MQQLSLNNFCKHLQEQVDNHSIYVWAAQGEGHNVISDDWIRKMETSENNANRAISFWHQQVDDGYGLVLKAFDCSGLGMYWLMKHMSTVDLPAREMYRLLCKPINKTDLKRGDWVFKKNSQGVISHIGYIVDSDLNVIEAKGRDDGIVKRPFKATTWTVFGRPQMFTRDIENEEDTWVVTRLLKRGCKGDDVKEMQKRLIERGFSCGSSGTDGSFGPATEKAVKAFQKDQWPVTPSEWDGLAGKKTLSRLGALCKW